MAWILSGGIMTYQEGPREGPGEGPREAPTEGPWELSLHILFLKKLDMCGVKLC